MKLSILTRPLAASTLLLFAACGGSGTSPSANADNEVAMNEELANLDDGVAESVNETGEGVELVSLPPAPADAAPADAAPLAQAAQIAGEIDGGTGIERVPFEGGWAWRRDGRIIRTASRDGRRVSWFHPGDSTPFLVQQGQETYAYAGGRPQRAFDRGGRPAPVPPQRQEEARHLADQSRHDRDQAEHAPRRPENGGAQPGGRGGDRDHNPPDRPARDTNASPPAGNSTAGRDDHRGDRDRRNRRDDQGNHQ